jgi:uncharacterized hydrophobic protein (TIGR00271 family)
MKTVLIVLSESGLASIPLAADIARTLGKPLALICATKDPDRRFDRVEAPDEETPELVRHAFAALEAEGVSHAEVYDSRAPAIRRAVIDGATELQAGQLILPMSLDGRTTPMRSTARALARAAPFDLLAIDMGAVRLPTRIVTPQLDGGGAFAIGLAGRLFANESRGVVAVADPKEATRSNRVFKKAKERLSEPKQAWLTQAPAGASLAESLGGVVVDSDLVLMSPERAVGIKRVLGTLGSLRGGKPERAIALGIARDARAAGPGRVDRWIERVRQYAPPLTREQRRDVCERLDAGGRVSFEFVVMLMLSAAIATLGLIQSSSAVVIGAMLVAPLMTPLVAIGMALVQGNQQMFARATRAMGIGIAGALIASMAIGLLSPWRELSTEVMARGEPNVFDLGIALLSGFAAAFAMARPGLMGTLVGVAIAVALVPPLASVGIATVKGDFRIAFGAAILFTTNLFAIIVGAALVFRFFGLDASLGGSRAPKWVRTVLLSIAVGLVPVSAILVHNLGDQIREGVHRPYARPLPPIVRRAIHERVAAEEGVEIVMMSQSDGQHDGGIRVLLTCTGPVDPALERDILEIVRTMHESKTPSRVYYLQAGTTRDE